MVGAGLQVFRHSHYRIGDADGDDQNDGQYCEQRDAADDQRGVAQGDGMRRSHWLVVAGLVVAVWASFAYLKIDVGELFSAESARQMWKYLVSFFPPDLTYDYLVRIWQGTLETIAISAIGTFLAAVLGLLIALPAAGRFGFVPRIISRLLLNFLRSIPELVWAALMVFAAGLGNHLISLGLLPASLAFGIMRDRSVLRVRTLAVATAIAVVGIGQYAFIVLRTVQGAPHLQARATTIGGVFDVLTAETEAVDRFRFSISQLFLNRLPAVARAIEGEMGLVAMLLIAIAIVFIVAGIVVFAISGDLPLGSMGMPGAGMMPKLIICLMVAFGLVLVARAGDTLPFSDVRWSDLPHAFRVLGITAVATAFYTTLGFVVTMAAMLFILLAVVEGKSLLRAAAFSLGVTVIAYVLFGTLLKSPLPQGIMGF